MRPDRLTRPAATALAILAGAIVLACEAPVPELEAFAGKSLSGMEISSEPIGADGYRVVIVGHAYGNFQDQNAVRPSRSLIRNLARINELEPSFTLLLGDFVRSPRSRYVVPLMTLLERLHGPTFVAAGEHDLMRGQEAYEQFFGTRYYSLRRGTELFLILDTGGAKGTTELSQEQRAFVDTLLGLAHDDDAIQNIVVLMHKVMWVDHPRYQGLRERVNNHRPGGFWNALYPGLRRLAATKSVYVGAGDIGHRSYSFILDRDPEDGISYFATGLADREWDSVAVMHFSPTGEVEIRPLSLGSRAIDVGATRLEGFADWNADEAAVR